MKLSRIFTGSMLLVLLGVGCRGNDNKTSSTNASTFSCSFKKSGELMLCTQYQDLTGSTLTAIQSECELRSSEGYSWAVAGCPGNNVGGGTCSLPASTQKPAPGTQFYYGAAFSSSGTASGMCDAQGGQFK